MGLTVCSERSIEVALLFGYSELIISSYSEDCFPYSCSLCQDVSRISLHSVLRCHTANFFQIVWYFGLLWFSCQNGSMEFHFNCHSILPAFPPSEPGVDESELCKLKLKLILQMYLERTELFFKSQAHSLFVYSNSPGLGTLAPRGSSRHGS